LPYVFQHRDAIMARTDRTPLVTEPAAEYVARTELERFDLRPYLP